MNVKIIVAAVVIVAFIVFGAVSFMDSNVEYTDFAQAEKTSKEGPSEGGVGEGKGNPIRRQGRTIHFLYDRRQQPRSEGCA